jgi:hypothetical protein
MTWAPVNPEIGQNVAFSLSGVPAGDLKVDWDFGGTAATRSPSSASARPS